MDMPHDPGPGQPAGHIELLQPFRPLLAATAHYPLTEALPHFRPSLLEAAVRAATAHKQRRTMPVLVPDDLSQIKAHSRTLRGIQSGPVFPWHLMPLQRQIYVDKVLDSMAHYGLAATSRFLLAEPIILSRDGFIIDGHHRWLSAMLLGPETKQAAVVLGLDAVAALRAGLALDRREGREHNA